MFRYQEIQATTDPFDAENNELVFNQIWRGQWYFAGSWTSEKINTEYCRLVSGRQKTQSG